MAAAAADDDEDRPPVVVPDKNYGFPRDAFDPSLLPDYDVDFLSAEAREAFVQALSAPDPAHGSEDVSHTLRLGSPVPGSAGLGRSSFDNSLTRRQSTAGGDNKGGDKEDPQEVAAHAAAAAADVSAPSLPNGNSVNGNGNAHGSAQRRDSLFITAQNDWAPVHQKIARTSTSGGGGTGGGSSGTGAKGHGKRRHKRPRTARPGRRTKDETREGYLYGLLKWPFLLFVSGWVLGLALAYVLTRYYIWFYEYFISWRGTRERLRRNMRATSGYREWRAAARELDEFLGNSAWKETNEFAYYDWKTVRRVWDSLKKSREKAEAVERSLSEGRPVGADERQDGEKAVEALRALLAACVKNNFVGVENPRLYSQTYYGTKNLVQNHVDEGMYRDRGLLRGCSTCNEMLTRGPNSREEPQVHPGHEADEARRQARAVQEPSRQLRPDGAVPVGRGDFCLLPLRRGQGAAGGGPAAGRDHGHERGRAGGRAGGDAD